MRRGSAFATGVVVVVAYAISAAVSGHLSPLARRPLLDGNVPLTPYRWVEPPPELASTNLEPSRERLELELVGKRGIAAAVLTTGDAQVTLIVPEGAFADAPDQSSVRITIDPLGPSGVSAPEPPLQIRGNVYSIEASYRPSGEPADLQEEVRVVLVYPAVANFHAAELLFSREGDEWDRLDTNDLPGIQQADALIQELGYIAVGGRPGPPTPSPAPESGDGVDAGVLAIAAGLLVLVIGTAIVMWPRRSASSIPGRGPRRGHTS